MLSQREILWRETWIDLSMKLRDMPRYEFDTKPDKDKKYRGNMDILKQKFSQFITPPTS